jgi:ribosomal protein L19E
MNEINNIRKEDFMDLDLQAISKYAEEIRSQWNGKFSGRAEERADIANDIIEKVKELRRLLAELDEF